MAPVTRGNNQAGRLAPKDENKRLPRRPSRAEVALYGLEKKRAPTGLEDDDEMLPEFDDASDEFEVEEKGQQVRLPDAKVARPARAAKAPVRYGDNIGQQACDPADEIFGDAPSASYFDKTPSFFPQESNLDIECDLFDSEEDVETFGWEQDEALGFRDEVDGIEEDEPAAYEQIDYKDRPIGHKRKARSQSPRAGVNKAARVSEPDQTANWTAAKEYVDYLNQNLKFSEDDEMVRRGRQMLEDWYSGFRDWVASLDEDWYKATSNEKGVAIWVTTLVKKLELRDIEYLILGWIPLVSLAALGRSIDEGPSAFLELPEPSPETRFRCTYFNVATDIGESNIINGTSPYTGRDNVKLPRSKKCVKEARVVKGYWGATARAIADRLYEHEGNTKSGKNYDFLQQPGVVSNWRMFAIFPMVEGKDPSGQDPDKALPFFTEGMLMSVTGTATKKNQPSVPKACCCDESYVVSGMLRANIKGEVPDFSARSLNIAWSLNQGLKGLRVRNCANPRCLISHRSRNPTAKTLPYYRSVGRLYPMETDDGCMLPKSFCTSCIRHYEDPRTKGQWRDPYDSVNLIVPNHDARAINEWWLRGNPDRKQQCQNCNVNIPEDATLFGMMNDIRCFRCAHFRVRERSEWTAERDSVKLPTKEACCDSCREADRQLTLRSDLDRVANKLGANYKGPQWICLACDEAWTVYGPRQQPRAGKTQQMIGGTKLEKMPFFCHELDCGTFRINEQRGFFNLTHLVHDTLKDVWRCLACDFNYCERKRESDPSFSKENTHHSNNKKECSLCARWYTFFPTWQPDEDGAVKCGECADRRCWNQHCEEHKSIATYLVYNEARGHRYCRRCSDHLSSVPNAAEHFQLRSLATRLGSNDFAKHLHSSSGVKPVCGNCNTSSPGRTWHWHHNTTEADPTFLRCYNCYMYRTKKGVDRPRPNTKQFVADLVDPVKCGNCSTGTSTRWYWKPKSTIASVALLRCDGCYKYTSTSRKSLERPPEKWTGTS